MKSLSTDREREREEAETGYSAVDSKETRQWDDVEEGAGGWAVLRDGCWCSFFRRPSSSFSVSPTPTCTRSWSMCRLRHDKWNSARTTRKNVVFNSSSLVQMTELLCMKRESRHDSSLHNDTSGVCTPETCYTARCFTAHQRHRRRPARHTSREDVNESLSCTSLYVKFSFFEYLEQRGVQKAQDSFAFFVWTPHISRKERRTKIPISAWYVSAYIRDFRSYLLNTKKILFHAVVKLSQGTRDPPICTGMHREEVREREREREI